MKYVVYKQVEERFLGESIDNKTKILQSEAHSGSCSNGRTLHKVLCIDQEALGKHKEGVL